MSRHKFVRDLDYDDYDDESYEDDYYEDEASVMPPSPATSRFVAGPTNTGVSFVTQKKPSQSQQKAMRNAIACVQEIVGDIDPNEIRIALEQCNLDVNAAAALLLDRVEPTAEPVLNVQDEIKSPEPFSAPSEPSRSVYDDRSLFDSVQIGLPSVPSPISTKPSALAQTLSTQLEIKKAVVLPPPPVKNAHDGGVIPFEFDEPSPDTRARTVHLKAVHTVAVGSTRKNATERSASPSAAKPAAPHHKGLSEAALRKRKERVKAIAEQEQANPSTNICLVVAGHVDAGKSTLMGHLLYLVGAVSSRDMHRLEKESRDQGKSSFKYAWVLDTGVDERSHGVTVDIATKHFSTEHRQVGLLDAPGHRDYVPNMIAGASQADCALLVVDAVTGEFESGFDDNGQTKEHAVLLKSFGIGEIVVVINKLDMMDWSQSRYQEIVDVMDAYLKSIGFRSSSIRYVPCSGLEGHNLVSEKLPAGLASWYKGPTLLQMIDTFNVPKRQIEAPLRAVCSDIFKSQMLSGNAVTASVLHGCLFDHDKVLLLPANQVVTIKGLVQDNTNVGFALPGQRVDVGLVGVSEESAVTIGSILSDVQDPLEMASFIHATIVTLDSMSRPILPGSQLILHSQSMEEPCTVSRLLSLLHKGTGDVLKRRPRLLTASQRANVVICVNRPIGLEPIEVSRQLGRFSLRREGRTVAVGIVTSVNKQ